MGETLSSTAAPEAPLGHPGPGGAQLENTQSNEYPCLIEVWCQPGSSPRFAFFGFLAVSLYDFCEFLRTRFLSVISGSLICLLLVWVRPMSCFPVLSCTSFCTPSARQGIQSISKNPWDSFLWEEHLWLRAGGITRAWGLTVQQARSLKGNMWDPCSFNPSATVWAPHSRFLLSAPLVSTLPHVCHASLGLFLIQNLLGISLCLMILGTHDLGLVTPSLCISRHFLGGGAVLWSHSNKPTLSFFGLLLFRLLVSASVFSFCHVYILSREII